MCHNLEKKNSHANPMINKSDKSTSMAIMQVGKYSIGNSNKLEKCWSVCRDFRGGCSPSNVM